MYSTCLRIKQPGQRAIWPRQSSTDPHHRAHIPDPLCLGFLLPTSCRFGGGVVSQLPSCFGERGAGTGPACCQDRGTPYPAAPLGGSPGAQSVSRLPCPWWYKDPCLMKKLVSKGQSLLQSNQKTPRRGRGVGDTSSLALRGGGGGAGFSPPPPTPCWG